MSFLQNVHQLRSVQTVIAQVRQMSSAVGVRITTYLTEYLLMVDDATVGLKFKPPMQFQKIIIGLDSGSIQSFIYMYLAPLGL